ncbi:MAG: TadE/TadG family type IV pilus assembly protein [Sphingomonas sp.]
MKHKLIRRDEQGAAAIEFAIAVPILVFFIYGIFQVGLLFEANAGMQHALGEGARLASLYDTTTTSHVPSDTAIKARINTKLYGQNGGSFTVSDPVTVTNSASGTYKTLQVSYTRQMSFLLAPGPSVTLTRTKRVYTTVNT